jgi:hypothetical protein
MSIEDKLSRLMEESVEASNRTTHAVRAFVMFLFIQLAFFTAAFLLWQIGVAFPDEDNCTVLGCEPHVFVLIFVALLLITGVILSSSAGWYELRKSNIPLSDRERIAVERAKMEALLEQERLHNEREERRREQDKVRTQKLKELAAYVKKPRVMIASAIVGVSLIFGSTFFYTYTTNWSNLVKPCDGLMLTTPTGIDDSYSFKGSSNELTLIVASTPRDSEWVDCIGKVLSADSPSNPLGRTVENKLRAGQESIVFGNLRVDSQKLDSYSYKIVISSIE